MIGGGERDGMRSRLPMAFACARGKRGREGDIWRRNVGIGLWSKMSNR